MSFNFNKMFVCSTL